MDAKGSELGLNSFRCDEIISEIAPDVIVFHGISGGDAHSCEILSR